jgi:Zn-dependent peptidase ImmA (M78 family)
VTVHLDIAPALLHWAVERAGWDDELAVDRFPEYGEWVSGTRQPTLKQVEQFARATHAPFGQLFLDEPPAEPLPIPDLRTIRDAGVKRPSVDLLDTIYLCQARQDWYRDYVLENGGGPVPYVGTATIEDEPNDVARRIRDLLEIDLVDRALATTWGAAFRLLIDHIEATGPLVMVSGIVGLNTHRPLTPDEFRGFALVDEFVPVLFVNGADSKAAQIFTLVHELAHMLLGDSALSDVAVGEENVHPTERWCNAVAAEVLLPAAVLRTEFRGDFSDSGLDQLARRFTVSTLVVLRRLFDTGLLGWDEYRTRYAEEEHRVRALLDEARESRSGDGNFYYALPLRLSRQFARAVIASTREGGTSYRDAYQLLGTRKHSTFEGLADHLGDA